MAWSYKDYADNAATVAAKKKKEETEASKPGAYSESEAVKQANAALQSHNANKPGAFTYGDYAESDTVKAAQDLLNQHMANQPGAYQSKWQQSLDDTMNKILNREKFTYDLNGDMLYKQYKDQYVNQGNMAMMDTMGQAAALTGGYGNSYAQTVGQQTYQGYLQQLNDKVPELYRLALDQYNREGEDLYNQYGLYADRDDRDYGRYRDDVSDWQVNRDYLTGRYDTEADRDYGRYSDSRNFAYGQHRDIVADWQTDRGYLADRADTEYSKDYGQHRDTVADWHAALQQAANDYYSERDFGYGQYSDNRNLSYTDYRNIVADQQWDKNYALSQAQFEEQKRANKASESAAWARIDADKKGDDPEEEDDKKGDEGFTGTSYSEAVAYMKANGVDGGVASGIMTAGEFSRWSNKKEFDGYKDYLNWVVKYNLSK